MSAYTYWVDVLPKLLRDARFRAELIDRLDQVCVLLVLFPMVVLFLECDFHVHFLAISQNLTQISPHAKIKGQKPKNLTVSPYIC